MQINKPRGTKDLIKTDLNSYNFVIDCCKTVAQNFGFEEVIIPTFEHAELFKRNNENSDIVKKELYEFKDRSDRLLALRPEATASLIRCLSENKLLKTTPLPIKIFTYGSMFRYERPQEKRQREFQQFDVEIVGSNTIYDVVDVISYAAQVLEKLNLLHQVSLKINFIGSFTTRNKWIEALQYYFNNYINQLSLLSQERLKTNPLRILDDKVDGKLPCVINAPKISSFLTDEEKNHFELALKLLDELKIKYEITTNLVRGLDYYTDIVFEFVDDKENVTIIGGGQYDKLVEELANIDLKAIGLAIGVNRCATMLDQTILKKIDEANSNKILLIGLKNVKQSHLFKLSNNLKRNNCPLVFHPTIIDIKKAIKWCEKMNYKYLAIVGLTEMENKTIQIKNLITQNQQLVKQTEIHKWWLEQLNYANGK